MKTLNKFIIEKLRLNKNVKLQTDELLNKIFFDYWGFSDDNEKIQSIISDWIDEYQVSDVYPVASIETLNELKYLLNKDIIDEAIKEVQKAYNILNIYRIKNKTIIQTIK